MTAFLVAADDGGDIPKVGTSVILQIFHGGPAKVGGIDVDMENNHGSGSFL